MNNENISPKETNFGKHLKIILPDGKVIENRSSGKSLAELVDVLVGRVLDLLGLENDLYKRWEGE